MPSLPLESMRQAEREVNEVMDILVEISTLLVFSPILLPTLFISVPPILLTRESIHANSSLI